MNRGKMAGCMAALYAGRMRSAMEGNGDEEAELAVGSQFLFKTYLSDRY